MKTVKELIKKSEWREDGVGSWVISSERAEEIAEIYAEEYVKALIETFMTHGFPVDLPADEILTIFKESLNK